MKALRFRLRGKTAMFKKPDVNTYYYFTYGQIHKPALLGIFGAIMGYQGYESIYDEYPEYYKKLQHVKVSVIPESQTGRFPSKMQVFNNSVGYANKKQEERENLIVREQWLEDPSWQIYLLVEDEESKRLAEQILQNECIYMPYLGKNDHPAILEEAVYVELEALEDWQGQIHSLAPADEMEYDWFESSFKYAEYLPVALKKTTNLYELRKFYFTDAQIVESQKVIYQDGEKKIVFC